MSLRTPETDRSREILVLGVRGLLGRALAERLDREARAWRGADRDVADLADAAAVRELLDRASPGAVINAAGFTDVGGAEDPARADEVTAVNRDLPGVLGAWAAKRGVPIVHVSTDYVYDGTLDRAYVETDPTRPLQVYGASKLAGEEALFRAHPYATVARTSTLYGPGARVRPHYVDAILAQARTQDVVTVVETPISCPTLSTDLAGYLLGLLDAGATGVFHATNRGACSRFELASAAVETAGLAGSTRVEARPEPPGGIARPRRIDLNLDRLSAVLGRAPRRWRDALAAYTAGVPA